MTPYSATELAQDWEFKIVRSEGRFGNPAFLQQVLAEEARAGWVLVEKFDQNRIRLKRPAAARERDGKLDFDPYRTEVGPSRTLLTLAILGGVAGFFLLMLLLASIFR